MVQPHPNRSESDVARPADAPTVGPPQSAASAPPPTHYPGPKDVGRAESLYRSAVNKPDPDYASQLLFSSLIANPEHEGALATILAKIPAYAAGRKKMVVRIADIVGGSPAEDFIRSLAAYCSGPTAEHALQCAAEAARVGLRGHAVTLGSKAMQHVESGDSMLRASALARLIDLLESVGALDQAVAAVRRASRLFPDDQSFREREKNLLASQYMRQTDLAAAPDFRTQLRDRERQQSLHRPTDPNIRLDELEQRYRQTHAFEDFRELVRGLRESSPQRREAALPVLRDGQDRFGDKETRWFVREIHLERKWSELRLHGQVLRENPANAGLTREHDALRREVLNEHVEHLYEVVSSLPPTPERHRRELELADKLLEAGRYEEAVKQSQSVRRRPEHRLEAWVIMAKAFVQLGFTPEATECFQSILFELAASPQGSAERVLDAKYAYARFLVQEAEKKADLVLARQARKLCADILIEDIDYRDARTLAALAERLAG